MISLLVGSDLVRWLVVAEMTLLLTAAFLLHGHHSADQDPEHRWLNRALLSIVGVLAVAVTVNAATGPPPTPGVFVAAVGCLPATVVAAILALHALLEPRARRRALAKEMDEILAWIDRMEQLDPCPDPGCIRARAEIRAIARSIGPAAT